MNDYDFILSKNIKSTDVSISLHRDGRYSIRFRNNVMKNIQYIRLAGKGQLLFFVPSSKEVGYYIVKDNHGSNSSVKLAKDASRFLPHDIIGDYLLYIDEKNIPFIRLYEKQ